MSWHAPSPPNHLSKMEERGEEGGGGKGGLLNVLENICLGKSEDFDFGGSALYGGGGGGNESIIWE